jgi:hypothetical protein
MRSLVMDLSVDLPEWVIESLAVTYHGMMPLERFVAETLGWGTGVANIQHREDKSSCDATVDSSEEAAVDDAVEEAEGQGEGRFPMV